MESIVLTAQKPSPDFVNEVLTRLPPDTLCDSKLERLTHAFGYNQVFTGGGDGAVGSDPAVKRYRALNNRGYIFFPPSPPPTGPGITTRGCFE